jgi:2,4-dienoyl-CoA reductase-like NADH-dependent reductase (Old Yellow Enzyme family)
MGPGVLREPDFCEKVIAEKKLDFVVIGRGLLADPDWPKKANPEMPIKSGNAFHVWMHVMAV